MIEETRATARVALAVLHHVEDQAGRDASLFDLLKCMVDFFQVSFLIDHMGLAVGMQLVHFRKVEAGSHNRPNDFDPIEYGLEDRQLHDLFQ